MAVSLDVEPTRALVQIFHEEVHPVTDPAVRAAGHAFDTAAIEETAVEVGAAVIEAVGEGFELPIEETYRRWRARFG